MERAAASGQPFMFAARSNAFMGEFEFKIAGASNTQRTQSFQPGSHQPLTDE